MKAFLLLSHTQECLQLRKGELWVSEAAILQGEWDVAWLPLHASGKFLPVFQQHLLQLVPSLLLT